LTPSSLSTSTLPELLVTPRLDCFATVRPAPAATNAAAVETLNVFASEEPVPAISSDVFCGRLTGMASERMTLAIPASSSPVSPLAVRAVNAAAICLGYVFWSVRIRKNFAASVALMSSPRTSRTRYGKSGVSAFAFVAVTGAERSQSDLDVDII